jgi:tetratricopeptide (TPR) repeat protein
VGLLIRLGAAATVSCGLGAGFWAGLQFGAGIDPGTASGAAVGLATVLVGLGAVWAAEPAGDSARSSKRRPRPGTGTLKGVTGFFTGRTDEWTEFSTRVRAIGTGKELRAAFMIHGMPGVGKSEFAEYAARELVAKYSRRARRAGLEMLPRLVELHGLDGLEPTDPKDALRFLLDLDGPDSRRSAMNLGQLSAEWRKHLDDKFPILLLDNAADADQVLPFLPGGSFYVVLVTSRRVLHDLITRGVQVFPLGVLREVEAVQLIKKITGRTLKKGDQQAIEGIAELCGCHPLAIKIAVIELARKSYISFADRLAQLSKTANRLLAIDEYTEESGGVARSFDLSYAQLPDGCRLALRRLGLAPVPIVNVEAATALVSLPLDVVAANLDRLEAEALIAEGADGYRLHDLIRRYARSLATHDGAAENEAAVNRLLAYYRGAAAYVDSILTRQPPPQAVEPPAATVSHDFADLPTVISWAKTELPNLLACADHVVHNAEGAGRGQEKTWVVLFVGALAGLLRNEGLWRRSIEFQTQAISAAEHINAPLAVANALNERGFLRRLTGELKEAAADLEQAIAICRETGGESAETAEAHALNTYGVVLDQLGRGTEGKQRLSSALGIYRRLNNVLGEANVLHDQGMAESIANNYDKAVGLLSQALALYQAVDQPLGMAHAYANLANAQRHVGLEREAADNLESAQALYRDLGNQLGEVTVFIQLGAVLRRQDRGRALGYLNDAVRLSTNIGNHLGHVNALVELAELFMADGNRKAAVETWLRALEITRKHGIKREEAKLVAKLSSLGVLKKSTTDDNDLI